jgi:transposase
MPRKPHPTDVSDEAWSFAAPYLALMTQDAPQRECSLREVFNALRWIVRAGSPWRSLPNEFPSWEAVYQRSQRWLDAGCFEVMVMDLRSIIRFACGRQGQSSAVVLDGRTLRSAAKVDHAVATTATNAREAARCTWPLTRWVTCWPCT